MHPLTFNRELQKHRLTVNSFLNLKEAWEKLPAKDRLCLLKDEILTEKRIEALNSIADKQREINDRIYPYGTKVLHRFRNCGVGIVEWTNENWIAVRFENGENTAYYPEEIKRLEYPIRGDRT